MNDSKQRFFTDANSYILATQRGVCFEYLH